MRASRLISLLLLLQMRGQLTANELADHFEVSVRTIHRDVEALGAAGVPVEAVRGPAGGYRLAGGYRTRLTGLTTEEAEALFVGPAAELGLGRVLADARLKLLAALPPELQERAERSGRLFHLDTTGWFRGEDRTPHLTTLASAVWEGRRVAARYREGPKVVRRTLDPLGLVFKAGAWYLVARRSVGMRVYRVSRFASVRVLEETFERPRDFELGAYWAESSERFVRERPRFDARIRTTRMGLRYLRGIVHPDGRAILDDAAKGSPEELVELTVPFDQLEYAYRELLTFGRDVEVLDPPELRERLRNAAQEVLALYGLNTG
ncbi:MAG TPA: YafY family protein [Gaiellaceae bacterium]|nr:YafY family protein [Gaiellaceae bacterium]